VGKHTWFWLMTKVRENIPGGVVVVRIFTIFHPAFSQSCTHRFHDLHPPGAFTSQFLAVCFLLCNHGAPFGTGGARPLALRWPDFGAKARFVHEVRKNSRLEGHSCSFWRSLMVQLVTFWLIFGADPTAVRFRYDSPSMTNWWARWQKRSKGLWHGIGLSRQAVEHSGGMPLLVTASVPVGPREAPEPTSIATLLLMPLVMLLNPPRCGLTKLCMWSLMAQFAL
jgi:hypothetical protein